MANGSPSAFENAVSRLNRLTQIFSDELEAIITNNRWISTLILAEIAGLVSYRQLSGEEGLSLKFAFVVLVLSASLALLVLSTILARTKRRELNLKVHKFVQKCSAFIGSSTVAENEQLSMLAERERNVYDEIEDPSSEARSAEKFGMILFGIGSVIAGIVILIGEFFQAIIESFLSLFVGGTP